jgi:diacylglycerol kinase (ATP)
MQPQNVGAGLVPARCHLGFNKTVTIRFYTIYSDKIRDIITILYFENGVDSLYYILCNPTAGGGRASETLKKLEAHMKEKGLAYEVGLSQYHKHSMQLVQDAVAKGYRSIFTLGGDGTVFEAVNGLAATGLLDEVSVGFLPGGTGNDFTRSLQATRDPVEAFEALRSGRVVQADLWKADGLYFINVFGLGLDTDLAGWAEKTKKLLKGMPAYILALFLTLFGYKFKKIKLTVDGKVMEREVVVLTASNGRYYGGGIDVAPDAHFADGKLELVIINKVAKVRIPGLLAKYIVGRHIKEIKECEYIRAESITIESVMQISCETDGEIEMKLPVSIGRSGKSVNVMVPADFNPEVI